MTERGVKVRGRVRRGRVREKLNGFFKEGVAVDRFEVATRDEDFGFRWDRQTE
jgi:hypothetical protein